MRKDFFATLGQQLETLKTATEELEEEHQDVHRQRAEAHCRREEEVRQRFEERIESLRAARKTEKEKAEEAEKEKRNLEQANTEGQQPLPEGIDLAMRQLQVFQESMKKQLADAAAEAAKAQQAHLMAALRVQLDAEAAQMKLANDRAKLQAARQEAYEASCAVDENALPVLQRAQGEQYQKQSQMLFLLRAWNASSTTAPVLFQDVVAHSDLGADAPLFMRTAMGSAWTRWFKDEPAAGTVVPRQVLQLLLASLEKVKLLCEAHEDEKDTETAAAGSYAKMASDTKKRRSKVLEVAMGIASA